MHSVTNTPGSTVSGTLKLSVVYRSVSDTKFSVFRHSSRLKQTGFSPISELMLLKVYLHLHCNYFMYDPLPSFDENFYRSKVLRELCQELNALIINTFGKEFKISKVLIKAMQLRIFQALLIVFVITSCDGKNEPFTWW